MDTTYVEMTDLEVRDAGGGTHELVGLCVPYDVPTTKVAGGRAEVFRHGAFAGVVGDRAKVRLRDQNHELRSRPVGTAVQLEERQDGLYGRFRFYNTPEGRAAYENVREETYGGLSVGFVSVRDRQTPTGREVLEARLHHVSLVDTPAYEDAKVLAVRHADEAAQDYAIFRNAPAVDVDLDGDDTPMMVRVRRRMSR